MAAVPYQAYIVPVGLVSVAPRGMALRYDLEPIPLGLFYLPFWSWAENPHVLRVRSGFCALSVSKLAAPITPGGIGSYSINFNNGDRHNNIPYNRISQVFRPRNFSSCATL
ncbi:hypothetical protein DNU54_05410 [Salmonella enterica subsp. enterica serovar Ajiobo]|nr:hypothetical protein [Salmonella enterica subsp. enterica serovar Ajiobo]EBR0126561.1 hypothetical protein [Salmonella enterica subsp. enterica serovar Ajiobo]EBW2364918.1 hypothetical protein [Salmonella enterica subsp. enterica serovar Ajiobo]EBZ0059075.1 hypothetical protein [Salmonella enterica subsp. enterica serovar Ajiobo]MMB94825.1 hypothetical protein [Salmonella enterica subsp. enterica serovar Ajiobo]